MSGTSFIIAITMAKMAKKRVERRHSGNIARPDAKDGTLRFSSAALACRKNLFIVHVKKSLYRER